MTTNGNSFKVAFWVMAVILTLGLGSQSTWIGANEVRNQKSHADIREHHTKEMADFKENVQKKFEVIMITLAELKINSELIKKKLEKND